MHIGIVIVDLGTSGRSFKFIPLTYPMGSSLSPEKKIISMGTGANCRERKWKQARNMWRSIASSHNQITCLLHVCGGFWQRLLPCSL